MASRKLLRQYVTDYQRDIERSVAEAKAGYTRYTTDTNAFNDLVQKGYDSSAKIAASNGESDLDNVGFDYYDRDTKQNISAGGTRNPAPTRTFGLDAPVNPDTAHNTGMWQTGEYRSPLMIFGADPTLVAASKARLDAGGVTFADNPVWDAYDKVWRNAPSAGVAPVQRKVQDPNLTNKEIGILQGKAPSYAEQAMNTQSRGSAFNDPQDPSNLKEAGVLTRAIAGKL